MTKICVTKVWDAYLCHNAEKKQQYNASINEYSWRYYRRQILFYNSEHS